MPEDTISSTVIEMVRRCLQFAHRHHKKAAAIVVCFIAGICSVSIIFQLLYPANRALPGTWIAGGFVSFKAPPEIKNALEKIDATTVRLRLGDKVAITSPRGAGLTFANQKNVDEVMRYPVSRRLIPFSFFLHDKVVVQKHLPAEVVAKDKLEVLAARLEDYGSLDPVEGAVGIKDGKVSEQRAVYGYEFSAPVIARSLAGLTASLPDEMAIPRRPLAPIFNNDVVHETASEATGITKPLTITVNDKSFIVDEKTVGSWIAFNPNPETKKIMIGFNNASIKAYLDGIANQVYRPPSATTITLTDNQETNRQSGAEGQYLDTTTATDGIVAALTKKQTSATLTTSPVVSIKKYVRTYSPTSAGLQALLSDWAIAHNGSGWAIAVSELGGQGRSASYRGDSSSETASVYKIFVSYSVQKRVAAGTLSTEAITATGQSVGTCLEIVIVHSDNPCGVALANMVGWDAVTADARAAGFSHTTIQFDSRISSPTDTNLFLAKLNNGTLLDASESAALLSRLKRQIYRSGVPRGNPGIVVANKVGFVNGYLNDAALVYAPTGTYVISAFSYGGSWPQVVDLAKAVKDFMAR